MNRHILATFTSTVLSVVIQSVSFAGESKAPIIDKVPLQDCLEFGASVEAGYMTDYLLHGLRVNRNTVSTGFEYRFEKMVPLVFGARHFSGINTIFPYTFVGPIDETDIFLRAEVARFAGFELDVHYTHRYLHYGSAFPIDGSYGDLGVDVRKDLGFVDLVAGSTLGLNSRNAFFAAGGGDGFVHRAGLEKSVPLGDAVSLQLSGGVGYHDGYFFRGSSDWSHYYLGAALPIELNCRTTLTPYLGYQGVQQWDVFAPQGDVLHAGISLNVSF